jgi:hypothetical protein
MPVTLRAWLSLLVFFAVLAVICFALPAGVANYLMAPLGCIVPVFYAAALVYGHPSAKVFAVGALAGFVALWLTWPQAAGLISANEIAPPTEVLIRVGASVAAGFLFQGAWSLVSRNRANVGAEVPQR